MQLQLFRGVNITQIYIHTHTSSRLLKSGVKITDTHTYTCPRLIACTTHTYISGRVSPTHIQEHLLYTYIHKQLSTGDWSEDNTYIHTPVPIHTLDCFHKYTYTSWCFPLSQILQHFLYTHAALHATCLLMSPVWDESSQQRRSCCRLCCETSGHGTPVF